MQEFMSDKQKEMLAKILETYDEILLCRQDAKNMTDEAVMALPEPDRTMYRAMKLSDEMPGIRSIIFGKDRNLAMAVAANANITSNTMQAICQSKDMELIRSIALNPHLNFYAVGKSGSKMPADVWLAGHGDQIVIQNLLLNDSTSTILVDKYAKSRNKVIAFLAMLNDNVSSFVLSDIARSKDPAFSKMAKSILSDRKASK